MLIITDDVVGRCCGGSVDKFDGIWDPGCGGFVGGKSALSYAKDGFFGTPFVTTWERGTNQGNLGSQLRAKGCMASNY